MDLRALFEKVNLSYRNRLQKFYFEDLQRLADTPGSGRNMIEPYDNMMKRFDLKFKRQYRFIANP